MSTARDDTSEDAFVRSHPDFIKAAQKSLRMMDARAKLPPGSSRARVTTANANWANAAESRDRIEERLRREFQAGSTRAVPVPSRSAPTTRAASPAKGKFPALAKEGQLVTIGRTVYRVHVTGRELVPYELIGPRGGVIEALRNIHHGQLYLMQGAKTLPGQASDASGVFVY